jgi:hypothetical protein
MIPHLGPQGITSHLWSAINTTHLRSIRINPPSLWNAGNQSDVPLDGDRPIPTPLTCTHHAKTPRNCIPLPLVQQTRADPSRQAKPQAWPEEEREGLG